MGRGERVLPHLQDPLPVFGPSQVVVQLPPTGTGQSTQLTPQTGPLPRPRGGWGWGGLGAGPGPEPLLVLLLTVGEGAALPVGTAGSGMDVFAELVLSRDSWGWPRFLPALCNPHTQLNPGVGVGAVQTARAVPLPSSLRHVLAHLELGVRVYLRPRPDPYPAGRLLGHSNWRPPLPTDGAFLEGALEEGLGLRGEGRNRLMAAGGVAYLADYLCLAHHGKAASGTVNRWPGRLASTETEKKDGPKSKRARERMREGEGGRPNSLSLRQKRPALAPAGARTARTGRRSKLFLSQK